ncbi:hypothetical protein BaRGS_00022149 [Batillaria attramentaria]|uniref:Uncharacterized protein n=1 Tax=Batillaria attramentaria TaxID=370345 RepID=A0ABD0KHY1_9CAEN
MTPALLSLAILVMEATALPPPDTAHAPSTKNTSRLFSPSDAFSAQSLNVKLSFEPYDETWSNFKKTYGRVYASADEESYRRQVFMDNVKKIEEHNHKFFTSTTTFWMGINQFTDMTLEEYRAYNKLRQRKPANSTTEARLNCKPFLPPLNFEVPKQVDWRTKGYVTPVKNQGQCGSCWAFSSTGSLEGQHFRAKGRLLSLSEQQLVDCSAQFGNKGCNGGWMDYAFQYIASIGGIEAESAYPYTASPWVVAGVSGCRDITKYSESDLQRAVASQGPVSVAIDASHGSFSNYEGGIYYEPQCNPTVQDHAVLVVGYGSQGGQDYWIVKNSWGQEWGNEGYILMARNRNNMCGIATDASFPEV